MGIPWEVLRGKTMLYVYCYINKINNKKYVGVTNNLERRKREHRSAAKLINSNTGDVFHMKLKEYGEENFHVIILEQIKSDDRDSLYASEEKWIQRLQTHISLKGYNISLGGIGVNRKSKISEEIDDIRAELKLGRSYDDIAYKFNISKSYLSLINTGAAFYDENVEYPLFKYYKDKKDYDKLIDLLINSDLSYRAIGVELNMSESTIKKVNYGKMRQGLYSNYPIRTETPYSKRAKLIQQLLIDGVEKNEVAAVTEASIRTVDRINSGESHKNNSLIYPLNKPVSTI